jgi:hypothetical protein
MRIRHYLQSHLERYLLRGATYQLLAVGALIGLISVVAGTLRRVGDEDPAELPESIWWAFLRLTDPGYLGDDHGALMRLLSTVVTVLGYVLFMGSLVAIMTQWLHSTIRRLEGGHTPIARNNHLVLLGWTARIPLVVNDIFLSENTVERFLRRRGARRMHIVVLAQNVTADLLQEIKTEVGPRWDANQVTLRSGNPLRMEHLDRCDFLHASAVIIPSGDVRKSGLEQADTRTIKTLMTMSRHSSVQSPAELPLVVAEILDGRKIEIARSAYAGPLELLGSDIVVARLVAQSIRHAGMSRIFSELLTHQNGNEIFVRDLPQLVGESVAVLRQRFPHGIFLGFVRREGDYVVPLINPSGDLVMTAEDRCVVMARSHPESEPANPSEANAENAAVAPESALKTGPVLEAPAVRRVLIVGWNYKVPAILEELSSASRIKYNVDSVSTVAAVERQRVVERYGLDARALNLQFVDADIMSITDLAKIRPERYDNIVLVSSDWLESGEEADARTLVAYLCLSRLLAQHAKCPPILLELLDDANVALLDSGRDDVLLTPVILGHMLTQVAMRRELNVVFNTLFGTGGAQIVFEDPTLLSYVGRELTFGEISRHAWRRGVTALGILQSEAGGRPKTILNPDPNSRWKLRADDEIVVLASESDEAPL